MTDVIVGADVPRFETYTASAAQTDFAIPFAYFHQSDVRAFVWRENDDGVMEHIATYFGGDGDMTCAPTEDGVVVTGVAGTATIPACEAGDLVVLDALTDPEREAQYTTQGEFKAARVNREFNRRVAVELELRTGGSRSIRAPQGEVMDVIPQRAADRAGRLLAFDEDGNPSTDPDVVGAAIDTRGFVATGGAQTIDGKKTLDIEGEALVVGDDGADSDNWIKLRGGGQEWNFGVYEDGKVYLWNEALGSRPFSIDPATDVAGFKLKPRGGTIGADANNLIPLHVENFGAINTGATHDGSTWTLPDAATNQATINAAMAYLRVASLVTEKPVVLELPDADVGVTTGVQAHEIRGTGWIIRGHGTRLISKTPGAVIFDLVGSRHGKVEGITTEGEGAWRGFQRGYGQAGTSASKVTLDNCYTRGTFTDKADYQGGSEQCINDSLQIENQYAGAIDISGATQANPCVITAVGHGFANGDKIDIRKVAGMIELNGGIYTVANRTADTFELSGVNSSGFTAYTSGGKVWQRGFEPGAIHLDGMNYGGRRSAAAGNLINKSIGAITNANPGVLTVTAHGYSNGNVVRIGYAAGVLGLNGRLFKVANATTDTFTLTTLADVAIDTTSMGTYTGSGEVWLVVPYSFVQPQYRNTDAFCQNGGIPIAISGPVMGARYFGYVYTLAGVGIDVYINTDADLLDVYPQDFEFDGLVEGANTAQIAAGGGCTAGVRVHREGGGDVVLSNWKVKMRGPQVQTALFQDTGESGKLYWHRQEHSIPYGGSVTPANMYLPADKHYGAGIIDARAFNGIAGPPARFSGLYILQDPHNWALPAGSYTIYCLKVNGVDAPYCIHKGPLRVIGTDAAIAAGGLVAAGYTELQGSNGRLTAPERAFAQDGFTSRSFSIADDAAASFSLPGTTPAAVILLSSSGGSGPQGLYSVRPSASPNCALLSNNANVNVGTSALAGTTGVDGKWTVAAANDGKVYIENRGGATLNVNVTIIAPI